MIVMQNKALKSMGMMQSFCVFSIITIVFFASVNFLIPFLQDNTNFDPVVRWFFVASVGLHLPQILLVFLLIKGEGINSYSDVLIKRLRLSMPSKFDCLWSIGAICFIALLSTLLAKLFMFFSLDISKQPYYLVFEPLVAGRYWIVILWIPFWILNILSEELLWRGAVLPRQELFFGNITWLYHGILWGGFHLVLGWRTVVIMLPILFILPYIVQRQKNTWCGIIIHAGINGPSVLILIFGNSISGGA